MSALTKAEMAEKLFDELGLNKREAKEVVELFLRKCVPHWRVTNRLSCRVLVILTFGIRASDLDATPRLAKKFPSQPDE